MWKHLLRITKFYQKIYPLRVTYNQTTQKFEPVQKPSKLYNWINAHIVQASVVAFVRCLVYLSSNKSEATMTFTDFIIDFLFLGLTLAWPAFIWSLWKWKDSHAWFLNQALHHRKIKGNQQII